MRLRAPANVFLHRAQIILILTALVSTILTTPLGIILLVSGGSSSVALVVGILVLAFCASSLTGYILGSIFLLRGASLVRLQSEFLSSVSHELRTPMTAMRMFIEALLDERLTDPEERRSCLAILHREMVRLDGLVGTLIELSRLESGRHAFEQEVVDVGELVERSIAAFDAIQIGNQARLDVEVEPDLRVIGDRAALTQVFVNLLSNAWKYTGKDKHITFFARPAGEREVELVVRDNGCGIPPSEQKRVFDKFVRGRAALESGTPGSGLGLPIVQGIAKAHNGRVELRPVPSGGACFHVFLPRVRPVSAAAAS